MRRLSFSELINLSRTIGVALVMLFTVSASSAATYKLYINKGQNASNYVVFDGDLTATVLHNAGGIELTLPGVEVQMRCKSTDQSVDSDSCLIALSPIDSSSNPETDLADSGCVITAWNPCEAEQPPATGGDDANDTPPSGGDGTCVSDSVIVCTNLDYGSGGTYAARPTQRVDIGVGKVLVNPFTVVRGTYTGSVQTVRTSVETPTNGARPKLWFSTTPNGAPISDACAKAFVFWDQNIEWQQTGQDPSVCQLANQAGKYFLNIAVCKTSSTDQTCSDADNRVWADRTTVLYMAGQVN